MKLRPKLFRKKKRGKENGVRPVAIILPDFDSPSVADAIELETNVRTDYVRPVPTVVKPTVPKVKDSTPHQNHQSIFLDQLKEISREHVKEAPPRIRNRTRSTVRAQVYSSELTAGSGFTELSPEASSIVNEINEAKKPKGEPLGQVELPCGVSLCILPQNFSESTSGIADSDPVGLRKRSNQFHGDRTLESRFETDSLESACKAVPVSDLPSKFGLCASAIDNDSSFRCGSNGKSSPIKQGTETYNYSVSNGEDSLKEVAPLSTQLRSGGEVKKGEVQLTDRTTNNPICSEKSLPSVADRLRRTNALLDQQKPAAVGVETQLGDSKTNFDTTKDDNVIQFSIQSQKTEKSRSLGQGITSSLCAGSVLTRESVSQHAKGILRRLSLHASDSPSDRTSGPDLEDNQSDVQARVTLDSVRHLGTTVSVESNSSKGIHLKDSSEKSNSTQDSTKSGSTVGSVESGSDKGSGKNESIIGSARAFLSTLSLHTKDLMSDENSAKIMFDKLNEAGKNQRYHAQRRSRRSRSATNSRSRGRSLVVKRTENAGESSDDLLEDLSLHTRDLLGMPGEVRHAREPSSDVLADLSLLTRDLLGMPREVGGECETRFSRHSRRSSEDLLADLSLHTRDLLGVQQDVSKCKDLPDDLLADLSLHTRDLIGMQPVDVSSRELSEDLLADLSLHTRDLLGPEMYFSESEMPNDLFQPAERSSAVTGPLAMSGDVHLSAHGTSLPRKLSCAGDLRDTQSQIQDCTEAFDPEPRAVVDMDLMQDLSRCAEGLLCSPESEKSASDNASNASKMSKTEGEANTRLDAEDLARQENTSSSVQKSLGTPASPTESLSKANDQCESIKVESLHRTDKSVANSILAQSLLLQELKTATGKEASFTTQDMIDLDAVHFASGNAHVSSPKYIRKVSNANLQTQGACEPTKTPSAAGSASSQPSGHHLIGCCLEPKSAENTIKSPLKKVKETGLLSSLNDEQREFMGLRPKAKPVVSRAFIFSPQETSAFHDTRPPMLQDDETYLDDASTLSTKLSLFANEKAGLVQGNPDTTAAL